MVFNSSACQSIGLVACQHRRSGGWLGRQSNEIPQPPFSKLTIWKIRVNRRFNSGSELATDECASPELTPAAVSLNKVESVLFDADLAGAGLEPVFAT